MKITITLLSRDKRGRQRTIDVHGEVLAPLGDDPFAVVRQLWEAEQAINAHTSIRCHVHVQEDAVQKTTPPPESRGGV